MDDSNPTQEIRRGDCIEEMRSMDENSVHAVVTDPPYGLAFLPGVNEWDEFDSPKDYQNFCEEWATECHRVLKPGGHLIAFSGNRTYGFLMCGVHAADFEIRDTITWHYGQGFGAGKTQSVTNWMDDEDDVEQWDGFKMGLKPATEFAALARKPLDGPTYANLLKHGTGALNIGQTRIPTDEERSTVDAGFIRRGRSDEDIFKVVDGSDEMAGSYDTTKDRYPANLLLDPDAARMLDGVSSEYGGDGGASRFFYTAKTSPNERSINGKVENEHSTVKPLELMEWLVTLVTAEGQRVLDPFAGSGTTLMACKRLGRAGVGIEKDEDHAELARKRVELAHELDTGFGNAPSDRTDDNGQPGLDAFADGGSE